MNVKEAIKERRAFRSLELIEISDEIVKDFAEKAQIAPYCMNKQTWNFVIVREKGQLEKLFTTLSIGNKWVEKASMIIEIFSKPENDCIIQERQYYLFDTGLAAAFIILRATELGLIAHPIAGCNEEKAKKILEIPDQMRLITLMVIGKHSKEINPGLSDSMKLGEKQRPARKKLEDFIFLNSYNNKFVEKGSDK
ncbi:MAG: nitroreductase family protein [Promethearchaeota archaeon]|nr:MAG: nitroreductase family protein [Candidatus Lokiarchaeota archaeon]